jgi:hypothetical protein
MAAQQGIIGLDPTYRRVLAADTTGKAPRPASLDGAVIGLLSNTKGRATDLLEAVYSELQAMHPSIGRPLLIRKPGYSVGPTPEQWAELTAEATVTVVALGA